MLTEHIPLPKSNSLILVIMYRVENDWVVAFYPRDNTVAGRYATEAEARAVRDELRTRCAVHYALTRAL